MMDTPEKGSDTTAQKRETTSGYEIKARTRPLMADYTNNNSIKETESGAETAEESSATYYSSSSYSSPPSSNSSGTPCLQGLWPESPNSGLEYLKPQSHTPISTFSSVFRTSETHIISPDLESILGPDRSAFMDPLEGCQIDTIETRLHQEHALFPVPLSSFLFPRPCSDHCSMEKPYSSPLTMSQDVHNNPHSQTSSPDQKPTTSPKESELSTSLSDDEEDSGGIKVHPLSQSHPDQDHNPDPDSPSQLSAGATITAPNTPLLRHIEMFTPLLPLPEIQPTSFDDVVHKISRFTVKDENDDYYDNYNDDDDDTISLLKVSQASVVPPVLLHPSSNLTPTDHYKQ